MNIKTFTHSLVFIGLLSLQTQAQDTLFVDAGGFEIHLVKQVIGNGPSIIMEQGMNMQLNWWFGLNDSLARRANVVTYDRAFLGKSGQGNTDRSGGVVASELKLALQNAGIHPPYILVGFSLGGHYVKAFARANPDDVKGLLLIDPLNTEDFYKDYKTKFPELYHLEIPKEDDPISYEAKFAFEDVYGDDGVPPKIPAQLLIGALAPKLPENEEPPYKNFDEDNLALQKLWVEHHLKWASFHPNVTPKVIEDASHFIHRYRIDAVLEAFDELMQTIKY
jgi:pimeloyl-ACP methyl ester carboxylesterase